MKNVPGEFFEMATPDGKGALNYALRVPKGVVAVIASWNLPLLLMTWKVSPALACGNAVVVKPSEQTPSTAALLGEVMVPLAQSQPASGVVQAADGALVTCGLRGVMRLSLPAKRQE